jgi:RHS repeat-associated protein
VYYLTGDQQGTDTLAINASSAAPTYRYYDPYGNPIGAAPSSWPGNQGFVGGTTDPDTGLVNLGAREYNSATGSFISPDPLLEPADPQDLNAYAYAADDPATNSDPSGAMFCSGGGYCGGGVGRTSNGTPTVNPGPYDDSSSGSSASSSPPPPSQWGCDPYVELCGASGGNPGGGTGPSGGSQSHYCPFQVCGRAPDVTVRTSPREVTPRQASTGLPACNVPVGRFVAPCPIPGRSGITLGKTVRNIWNDILNRIPSGTVGLCGNELGGIFNSIFGRSTCAMVSFNRSTHDLQLGITLTTTQNGVIVPSLGVSGGLYESNSPNIVDNGGPFAVAGGSLDAIDGSSAGIDAFSGQGPDGAIRGEQQTFGVGITSLYLGPVGVEVHVMQTNTLAIPLWNLHL